MKFIHMADCHLGGWSEPELAKLNLDSFKFVIESAIKDKIDFLLIAGDLFDSAYPSIEVLKEAFEQFRKIKESKIPVFIIPGSHDYSVSGKTFLDVLEKGGLCKNVVQYEERNDKIILLPHIYESVAIYGYPGKKSGLEVDDLKRMRLQDSPGMFRILLLHTAIDEALPNLNIKSISLKELPNADYIALGHLHNFFAKDNMVYPGPTFPNSTSELENIKYGSYSYFNNGSISKIQIPTKQTQTIKINITNCLKATEEVINELTKVDLSDKIVVLRLSGLIEQGSLSDINFAKIEDFAKERNVYFLIKNISNLITPEFRIKIDLSNTEDLENKIINQFIESHPSKFNSLIPSLIKSLQSEKKEDERINIFEERLFSEVSKILL